MVIVAGGAADEDFITIGREIPAHARNGASGPALIQLFRSSFLTNERRQSRFIPLTDNFRNLTQTAIQLRDLAINLHHSLSDLLPRALCFAVLSKALRRFILQRNVLVNFDFDRRRSVSVVIGDRDSVTQAFCSGEVGEQEVADAFVFSGIAVTSEVLVQVLFQFLFLAKRFKQLGTDGVSARVKLSRLIEGREVGVGGL